MHREEARKSGGGWHIELRVKMTKTKNKIRGKNHKLKTINEMEDERRAGKNLIGKMHQVGVLVGIDCQSGGL